MKNERMLRNIKITFLDAKITEKMQADFIVRGVIDGVAVEEMVTVSDIDILNSIKRTDGINSLSTYEFLVEIKKIKDSLDDSEYIKDLFALKACKQNEKKQMEIEKLYLMTELIKPKTKNAKKCTTYNNQGKIIVHQI